MQVGSAESAGGRLGAVLAAPRTGLVPMGAHGPWLVTTPALARQVLTEPDAFDFPGDVSRSDDLSGSRGDTRSGHVAFAATTPAQVARGVASFTSEWDVALATHDRDRPGEPYDAMELLRRPVSRSTTDAVLGQVGETQRHTIADQVLTWIDALGPIISARRPPGRWSGARRRELAARTALEDTLATVPGPDVSPAQTAALLAAGVQVPIAAGAWLIAWLAQHGTDHVDPVHAVWETLRLTPPTWTTARITTHDLDLDGHQVRAGAVVLVSPLLLGRLPELVPGAPAGLPGFDPDRWRGSSPRPGAWLPFGAGPHACPGRNLGMAVLVELAQWCTHHVLVLSEDVEVDQSRGIAPLPCRFTVATRRESA